MASAHVLQRTQSVERPLAEVFDFFARAENLEAITPGFLRFRILTSLPIEMREGQRIEYGLSLFGVPLRWRSVITEWVPGHHFVDEQESGPYRSWRHLHEFEDHGDHVIVRDTVRYELPLGPLGGLAHKLLVARMLGAIFDHRRETVARLLAPQRSDPTRESGEWAAPDEVPPSASVPSRRARS